MTCFADDGDRGAGGGRARSGMPRFFFDLSIGDVEMRDPGGMFHEHVEAAVAAADKMARDLFIWRVDLRDCEAWVRLRDAKGREIYRTAVWSETAGRERRDQP